MGNAMLESVCMCEKGCFEDPAKAQNMYSSSNMYKDSPKENNIKQNDEERLEPLDNPKHCTTHSREQMDETVFKWHVKGAYRLNRDTSELQLELSPKSELIASDTRLNQSFSQETMKLIT